MFNQAIAFEHPLNELIRTFLRLEHLFEKIDHYLSGTDEWATRAVMSTMLDILSITRVESKNEVLAELERCTLALERLGQQTGVDPNALKRVLDNLKIAADNIRQLENQVAKSPRDSVFLKTILQRSRIPGGDCSFDLPHYSYWLRQPYAQRQRQIDTWMLSLLPIRDGVNLLLSLARSSCDPKEVTASAGLYQDVLDMQIPIQMIRIQIDAGLSLFPEISGHKHRFNIRFMEVKDVERPIQTEKDVKFLLTCCVL